MDVSNICGTFINLLCYADDMVLLALSWWELQCVLNVKEYEATSVNMTFNTKEKQYAWHSIPASDASYIVCTSFPSFKLADFGKVCSVTEFKYLGHLKHVPDTFNFSLNV